jgi:histidine triad (HIT) family protein
MAADCLFCRIARREIPANIVAETDALIALRDINPQAPTHILVIPREHVSDVTAVRDPMLLGRMSMFASELAAREGIDKSGFRTVINTNADAGQTVFHLHLHLLGGRPMSWPPG